MVCYCGERERECLKIGSSSQWFGTVERERKLKDWEQLTVVCYCGERGERTLKDWEQLTVVCYCGERENA